jgi:hypothetical protein
MLAETPVPRERIFSSLWRAQSTLSRPLCGCLELVQRDTESLGPCLMEVLHAPSVENVEGNSWHDYGCHRKRDLWHKCFEFGSIGELG